jgi:hypothetical protein
MSCCHKIDNRDVDSEFDTLIQRYACMCTYLYILVLDNCDVVVTQNYVDNMFIMCCPCNIITCIPGIIIYSCHECILYTHNKCLYNNMMNCILCSKPQSEPQSEPQMTRE